MRPLQTDAVDVMLETTQLTTPSEIGVVYRVDGCGRRILLSKAGPQVARDLEVRRVCPLGIGSSPRSGVGEERERQLREWGEVGDEGRG